MAHENKEKDRATTSTKLEVTQNRSKTIFYDSFDRIFNALVHLKIMRVFVESVLRFGLPKNS